MGFFKDFKDDLSQAVNEANDESVMTDGMMVNTLDNVPVDVAVNDVVAAIAAKEEKEAQMEAKAKEEKEKAKAERIAMEAAEKTVIIDDEEKAVITKSLVIKGDMTTEGSMEIHGTVEGNIICKGNLFITGKVIGDASAATIAISGAVVEGDLDSEGDITVGDKSRVVGNLTATSAIIAGAVKGNIDVKGPVVIDSTAIVAGDIKSKSMQINVGSVIEGHCSQCYCDVDAEEFFNK